MTTASVPRIWCETGTKTDPGAAAALTGFVAGNPVSAPAVNHILNAVTANARRSLFERTLMLREHTASTAISDSTANMAIVGGRTPGHPSVVLKSGTNDVLHLWDYSLRETVGSVASITSVIAGAARNGNTFAAIRIVAIGTGGNRCCFSDDEGSTWTAGSNLGGTPHAIVFNNTHGRFLVTFVSTLNVANDTDAASTWTNVTSGLTTGLGGLAVLSNGNTVVCGNDGSGFIDFSVSTDGGTTWSTAGAAGGGIPNFGAYTSAEPGWVCGNNGAKVYHVGRANGGTEIRVCESTNGSTWTLLKTLTPPGAIMGLLFNSAPRIYMCQQTGLLVVHGTADGPLGSIGVMFASADLGATWTDAGLYSFAGPTSATGVGVADGRVFLTLGVRLFVSDGIGRA